MNLIRNPQSAIRNWMRDLFKITWSAFLFYTGLLFLLQFISSRRKKGGEVFILKYHRISNFEKGEEAFPFETGVKVEDFERQINYLSQRHRIISLKEVAAYLEGESELPPLSVVITFDDGYEDAFLLAYPILKKYGVKAIVFISPAYTGTGVISWRDKLTEIVRMAGLSEIKQEAANLNYPDRVREILTQAELDTFKDRIDVLKDLTEFLKRIDDKEARAAVDNLARRVAWQQGDWKRHLNVSWEQAAEMAANGIEFGAHTLTHPPLTKIASQQAMYEIKDSKQEIEQRLGKAVSFFCYPYGDFNEETKAMVKEAGFMGACCSKYGVVERGSDLYALKRIGMELKFDAPPGRFSKAIFAVEMSGLADMLFFRGGL
ncbi:MAG: polysaccharide deacetylase family protein [bacterium]|nr:polysaccharide deacetylase family protein [bacterium]